MKQSVVNMQWISCKYALLPFLFSGSLWANKISMTFLLLIPMTYLNFPQFDSSFCLFTHNSLFFLLTSLNNLLRKSRTCRNLIIQNWSKNEQLSLFQRGPTNSPLPSSYVIILLTCDLKFVREIFIESLLCVQCSRNCFVFFFSQKANSLFGTSRSVIVASIISKFELSTEEAFHKLQANKKRPSCLYSQENSRSYYS